MNITIILADVSLLGGTERSISNLINLYNEDDHLFTIISLSSSGGQKPKFDMHGAHIIHLALPPLQSSFVNKMHWYFMAVKCVRRVLSSLRSDIVLGYGHNISIMIPFLGLKNTRKYACEHINFDTIPITSKILMRLSYPNLDGIIALSKTAKGKFKHLNKNIYIIPNAVSFCSDNCSSLNNQRIIMIGRISHEKGIERLIPIASFLKETYPQWHIDIFGDGPLKNKLMGLFDDNNLSDVVRFWGNTDNVKDELLQSDMLLMTSYTEALPIVIIEAKSVGVPSIAYSCEGTVELIDNGIDGFVVDNQEEFIGKLTILINSHHMREKFGKAAYIHSQKFRPSNIKILWDRLFYARVL